MANSYNAYSVYYYNTDTPPVGFGMAGRIIDAGGTSIAPVPDLQKTNLNGDPKVEGFTDGGGTLRIAVTDYVTGSAEPVRIYGAATPGTPASVTWSNVINLYDLVNVGSYLYALDYDNARVVEINSTTYAQTGVSYTLAAGFIPSGYVAHGQALINIGGVLYGLFTFVDNAWTNYANSLLVRFTISAGSSITVGATDYNNNLAKNGFGVAVNGSDLYIAAIGGKETAGSYNAASRLQSIPYGAANLSTATVTDVLAPSATYPYEIRDISFKGSTAYVLMGAYNASWQMNGVLLSTTNFTSFSTINTITNVAAYFWAAQYVAANDRIWYGRGNQILVYTAASPASPVKTMSLTAGSLISTGELYDNINDMCYVGATGVLTKARGYRSPLQASSSPRAAHARALTKGRPELTDDELRQLDQAFPTT